MPLSSWGLFRYCHTQHIGRLFYRADRPPSSSAHVPRSLESDYPNACIISFRITWISFSWFASSAGRMNG